MRNFKIGETINNYKILEQLDDNGYKLLASQTFQGQVKYFVLHFIDLIDAAQKGITAEFLELSSLKLIELSEQPLAERYMSCYYNVFTLSYSDKEEYLVMVGDYINGYTLAHMLLSEKLSKNTILQIMSGIADAVDFIHTNNVVHQNIKPSNIMFDTFDKRFKLIDFTSACFYKYNDLCRHLGYTIYYTPPELFQHGDPTFKDKLKHDIWSIGVVFYQIANQNQDYIKFTSQDPKIIAKDIQLLPINSSNNVYQPINKIVNFVLQKNPNKRPTADQIKIMIKINRPLCLLNNHSFTRNQGEAILLSLGKDPIELNDYELCKELTNELHLCTVQGQHYQKKQLVKLAKLLGLNVSKRMVDSEQLCRTVKNLLKEQHDYFSKKITDRLVKYIEYISWIQVSLEREKTQKSIDIYNMLSKKFKKTFGFAQEQYLINKFIIETFIKQSKLKARVYEANKNTDLTRIYNKIHDNLNKLLQTRAF